MREIERGVAVQHFVIEAQHVEPHDKIGALKFREQVVDVFFTVDVILALRGVVGHADAESHLVDVPPAAHFISGLLRFQIEIDNVLRHARPKAK